MQCKSPCLMGNVFHSSVSLLKGNMFLGGVFHGCVQRLTFAGTYGRPANIYGCNPSMRAGGLQGKHHKKSVCAWEYGNTIINHWILRHPVSKHLLTAQQLDPPSCSFDLTWGCS